MDIRIARVMMLTARQIYDAADDTLEKQLQVISALDSGLINAEQNPGLRAQAEGAIPPLREVVKQAIEGMDALTEIITDHKTAIARVDALPSTVFPPDGPGDDGGQKH